MNRKEYRKKKLANNYAKTNKIPIARAWQCVDVINKVCSELGPLNEFQRNKVWRMLLIALEEPPKKTTGFR